MGVAQPEQPIAGMTLRELRALIAEEVRAQLVGAAEVQVQAHIQEPDPAAAAEALRWLHKHRLPSPPGAPSVVEMLREDRDQ